MAQYEYDIGIIGAGAAGLTVAAGAAQLGARTLLIEKEPALGGDCLHFGCVPSKTLIRSAQVYHQIRRAADYGLPAVDLPPVDFKRVADRVRAVVARVQEHDSEARFCRLGVKVLFGAARFQDPHAVSVDGRTARARNWVIATGSSPLRPPIEGLAQTAHLTNREIFYLDRLPASMIVLGGGPIGIEMAQAFNRFGTKVTVVDMASQILVKEDRDMAAAVMARLAEEGVVFRLEAAVTRVADRDGGKCVTLREGDGQSTTVSAETLLVAVGRTANVHDLGLDDAGIGFSRAGIKVDGRLRTTQSHIYAAGDVNGAYQFTHAAGYEAGIVISNAVFRLPRKADYRYLPWCTYCDPELASIGLNEKAAQAAGFEYRVWSEKFAGNDRSLAEGVAEGTIKLILDAKEQPLGVQILGPHAGELLNEWVAAFNGRIKLATLATAVHPYPTLGEINKRVAGSVMAPKLFSDRVRKGLKLFFNLKGRACGENRQACAAACDTEREV